MKQLKEILQEMAGEIPGLMGTAVVGMDGLGLARYEVSAEFSVEVAEVQFAMVMKLAQKTCKQLGEDEMEDNLVTTDDAFMYCRFFSDTNYYLGIAANQKEATLGNIRLIARQYEELLWDNIPKRKK
jgi:predicted regulator of Ras-like GTPase activity (Roadblock/LC7/MglB family)